MADRSASSAPGAGAAPLPSPAPSEASEADTTRPLLRRATRAVRVIVGVNDAIRRARDEAEFYRRVCQVAVERGGYRTAWIGVAEVDRAATVRPVVHAGAEFVDGLHISWSARAAHAGPAALALQTGAIVTVADVARDARFAVHRREFERYGIASIAALPLAPQGDLRRVLLLYAALAAPFDEEELELLRELVALVEHGVAYLRDQVALAQAQATLAGFLRQKDELLQRVLELLPVGVWIVDAQGQSVQANPAAARIWGEELVADSSNFAQYRAWRLPARVPLPASECALLRALRAGVTTVDEELEIERPDGTRRVILDSAMPLRGPDGVIAGAVNVNLDISARKAAEEALRASEARLQLLLARSPAAIFVSDAQRSGALRFVSDSISQLIGYRPDEFLNVPDFWSSHIHPDDHGRVLAEVSAAKAALDQTQEFRFRHRDGHYVWLRSGLALVRDAAGAYVEVVGYVIDVTGRKQMEQALQENRDALRQANDALALALRTKDEFMAAVSHELRTPLAAILGLTESLQDGVYGVLNQRQASAIEALDESGRHLLEMINDILDVARSDLGQMTLQLELVDIDTVCSASLRVVEATAAKKGVRLQFVCEPIDMVTIAEPQRLRQILVNLLSNAIKFTPAEGEVGLRVQGDRAAGLINFSVWDTGIGIAPEELERLFQPFVQLNTGLSRQFGGTGLGLVLVKRLAEAHGGRVQVESTLGAGSCFTVTLGWSRPGDEQNGAQEAPDATAFAPELVVAGRPCVLLAEDSEYTLVAYSDYLARAGFRVELARNGFEAVAMAQKVRPAVILMDIQMPGMDGYEAMRRLRADPDPEVAGVPILALTALAMPGDRERCLDAGATLYLAKPISLPVLAAHLKAQVVE